MSWSDLDLTLDLAVVTLTYKILSGLFNARREIHTAAVVLLPLKMNLLFLVQCQKTSSFSCQYSWKSSSSG